MCGLPEQGLGELPEDTAEGPTPWRGGAQLVAAVTCPQGRIWAPGGNLHFSFGPAWLTVAGWDSPVSLKLQPEDLILKRKAYVSRTDCWVLPAGCR